MNPTHPTAPASMASISPYPAEVAVRGDNVFVSGKYAGYVDRVQNWGTNFLARPETGRNQFFATKTAAVLHIAATLTAAHAKADGMKGSQ